MERELNHINVIPLVDVMLVLLVIVLTTATFISTGQIPVQLAHSSSPTDTTDVAIVVTLSAEGAIYLNGAPIASETLRSQRARHSNELSVLVRADRVTLLERFVTVVDEIKSVGFHHVSLQVAGT